MKKSDLKRIIREEIQKLQTLNEAELVTSVTGEFDKYGDIYTYKCTYCCDSNGMSFEVYSNNPCSSTYGSAPGGGSSNSSDFKRPNKKVKDPNFGGGNTDPNPGDFSGGVGHPGGPGKSGKTRLREQNINDTWDGSCGSIMTHYVGDDLKSLCLKCDLGIGGPGSYEQQMDPSPCDCTVPYAGSMISLPDFCRAKFPNLGLGLGTDTDDPIDDPLDASTGTYIGTAIPAEPEKGPKPGLPGKPEDDGKLPFSILKRAGIKPKPRAPRRPRRR